MTQITGVQQVDAPLLTTGYQELEPREQHGAGGAQIQIARIKALLVVWCEPMELLKVGAEFDDTATPRICRTHKSLRVVRGLAVTAIAGRGVNGNSVTSKPIAGLPNSAPVSIRVHDVGKKNTIRILSNSKFDRNGQLLSGNS